MTPSQADLLASGHLRVTDQDEIYWEMSGNPEGKPALYLHGGPGSGLRTGTYRTYFDLRRYRLVGLDQRGCGRSRPLVATSPDRLAGNRTEALIADIEALRHHLGIAQWLVAGVSWGSTLALAYAQAHPDRITALVLNAVTTTSREEVDWITESMGRLFPEAWETFEQASGRREGERIVEAYARRLASGDQEDRLRAARAWIAWEDTHIALDPNWAPNSARFDEVAALGFATLVTHYWAHDAFLRDGQEILARMARLAHIPAVLIHGRRDISGPVITPWRLHRAWPASRLRIVEEDGHSGPGSVKEMRQALEEFASRSS